MEVGIYNRDFYFAQPCVYRMRYRSKVKFKIISWIEKFTVVTTRLQNFAGEKHHCYQHQYWSTLKITVQRKRKRKTAWIELSATASDVTNRGFRWLVQTFRFDDCQRFFFSQNKLIIFESQCQNQLLWNFNLSFRVSNSQLEIYPIKHIRPSFPDFLFVRYWLSAFYDSALDPNFYSFYDVQLTSFEKKRLLVINFRALALSISKFLCKRLDNRIFFILSNGNFPFVLVATHKKPISKPIITPKFIFVCINSRFSRSIQFSTSAVIKNKKRESKLCLISCLSLSQIVKTTCWISRVLKEQKETRIKLPAGPCRLVIWYKTLY